MESFKINFVSFLFLPPFSDFLANQSSRMGSRSMRGASVFLRDGWAPHQQDDGDSSPVPGDTNLLFCLLPPTQAAPVTLQSPPKWRWAPKIQDSQSRGGLGELGLGKLHQDRIPHALPKSSLVGRWGRHRRSHTLCLITGPKSAMCHRTVQVSPHPRALTPPSLVHLEVHVHKSHCSLINRRFPSGFF